MKTKHDLLELGFSAAGTWKLYQRRKSGVGTHLDCFQRERVIYAFLLDGECKCIGIRDDPGTTLADRMSRYEGKVGNGTNERICNLIQEHLSNGHTIEIMALKPDASLGFAKLKIDLVRGLEIPLIHWAEPEWNRRSRLRTGELRYIPVDLLTPKKK